jgi:L-threonylcarbamoyladenylate synthase
MPRCLPVDPQCPEVAVVQEALGVLRHGGVVAYPTDTVYGLAVDAMNPEAVSRLYRVKQRPAEKALPIIIGGLEQLCWLVATRSPTAERLIAAFWPGPLTLLMVPREHVPTCVLGNSSRVGIRWPQAPLSQQLALGLGRAVTATSANLSEMPVALSAAEVTAQLASGVDFILDGGTVPHCEVSTILDVTVEPPRLCRPGKIDVRSLEAVLGYPVAQPLRIPGREQNPLEPEPEKG